jgi:RHS repeat-associated protein
MAVKGSVPSNAAWVVDRLISVSRASGLYQNMTASNHFNPFYGRDAMICSFPSSTLETDYGYDSFGRMNGVSCGASQVAYGYLPDSDLLETTSFSSSSGVVLTTARQWDYGFRLGSIGNVANGTTITSHSYTYDALNRRTEAQLEDGSYWGYSYDDRNELTGAGRNWPDNTAVAGQQYGYGFDNIGNRTSAQFGSVGSLSTVSYTANSLNEYTGIVTPGSKDIMGLAIATNTVTVNGGVADRKGEFFHKAINVANSGGPVWQEVTNCAGTSTVTGGLVFPAGSQTHVYDADGNLTSDGIWTYQWDAENRLISMSMTNISGIANSNRLRLDFAYDYMNRRISKIVSTNSGSAFVPQSTNYFIYDGWNLIAVFTPAGAIQQSFVWGLDLRGTMANAGGVGGLLAIANSGTNYFASYDGNGNITGLINGTDKSTSARYEYSPFGELIRATGPMAKTNPFRFSTKFCDDESGLDYYGYRYYNSTTGRWMGRDSAGEDKGGINLFNFVDNDPISQVDTLGDWTFGIGLTGGSTLFVAVGVDVGIYIGRDPKTGRWSWGVLAEPKIGAGAGISLAGGVFAGWTSAASVKDLKGLSYELGASLGEGAIFGADLSTGATGLGQNTLPYEGIAGSLTAGIGTLAEAHMVLSVVAGYDSDSGWGDGD